MNPTRIAILIISYNTREMTLACLRSVFEQAQKQDFELIVLDNASSDGSAEAIEAEFGDRLRLIKSPDNLGFAGGNNEAAGHATGEYLLLLNPDTVVLDHAIDRLLEFAEANPGAGIWGGRTVFADGSLNPASCWKRATAWSMLCQASGLARIFRNSSVFNPEAYGGWGRDSVRLVDIVSGCFFLIRRELWEKLGGFDLTYFMYGEEADLCLRAREHGARTMVTPDATIVHYGGASEKVRADKLVRLLAAKATLIRRHWPRWKAPFGLALLASWPLSRVVALSALKVAGRDRDARKAWVEVWQRRADWSRGYPARQTS
ncbi:MAG: glycosyltransferase family 2 protein [Phycisphaerales bacterium]